MRTTVGRWTKVGGRKELLSPTHVLLLIEGEHEGNEPSGGLPVGANGCSASRAIASRRGVRWTTGFVSESSKDSSVLQLVSCFCRHRVSWSVGTSRQTSPCTDRPVSETRGAIPLSGLSLHHRDTCGHSFWLTSSSTSRSNPTLTPPLTAASGSPNCTVRLPLVVLSSNSVHSPSDLTRPERRPLL